MSVLFWLGPGRYLVLCAALFILLAGRIWTDAWRGDFWIYVATIKELALHALHPRNPLLGNDYAFAFFSPYTWALGVASRLSGLRSFEVIVLQGFVNLALFLGALYAFVTTWVGRRSAAFYALLFALFLWGRDPWIFSSFFHFRSLSFVLSYPSTFAAALALASLALFARLAGSGSQVWGLVAVPAMALLWILHPVNGLFLWLGLLAFSLQKPRTASHWLGLAVAFVASLGLAFSWPLFSVWDLWFGQIEQVHEGNAAVYDDPLPRVAPALLGVPWLLMRLHRNKRDPLALLALGLTVLVAYGGLFGKWSYGRLVSHVVLLLQVALADASAALEDRLGQLRAGAALRHFQAPALAALLVGASWSSAVKPTLEEGWRGNPRWLEFLESRVETHDVVLTDLETCWYVPSFSGKVVAFPMLLPFVPDHAARVRAVERFFGPEASLDERLAILERYRVRWVLLDKEHVTDWRARLEELRPIARVVFSDTKHELLSIGTAPVPVRRRTVANQAALLDRASSAPRGRTPGKSRGRVRPIVNKVSMAATIGREQAAPPRMVPHRVVPGLELVEDVLFRLAVGDEPDLAAVLLQLCDALGAQGACICESASGEPLIMASAGDLKDMPVAALREFVLRAPSAPMPAEMAAFPGEPRLTGVVLPSSAGKRSALVVWGEASVGGAGIERLLRVILLVANRLHPRSLPGGDERSVRSESAIIFPEGYIPGHSAAILELYAQMRPLVLGDVPVLLLGETGVGKEHLAHVLHASSRRRNGPFVAVNCAAIPADLLEAEMFGIAKGVATGVGERPGKFQLADGGTLFLDEIGDMSPALQAKLLRALQGEKIQPVGGAPVRVDTRVVTATNSDLDGKIAKGQFRRDLYFRVAGFVLRVPPLRERREDIPELVQVLLCVSARETGKSVPAITAEALRALAGYGWPGNVRELEHEVRRLVYLCQDGQPIDRPRLSERILVCAEDEQVNTTPSSLALEANIAHIERRLIRAALARARGKRSAAARLLGVSRNGLAMKMERLGLIPSARTDPGHFWRQTARS